MQAQDFLLDSNGDLLIENGDFVVGASDPQNIQDTINAYAGYWKQFPTLGVGIEQYLNSPGLAGELKRLITVQLQSDGFTVNSITVDQFFNVQIDATRQ